MLQPYPPACFSAYATGRGGGSGGGGFDTSFHNTRWPACMTAHATALELPQHPVACLHGSACYSP